MSGRVIGIQPAASGDMDQNGGMDRNLEFAPGHPARNVSACRSAGRGQMTDPGPAMPSAPGGILGGGARDEGAGNRTHRALRGTRADAALRG